MEVAYALRREYEGTVVQRVDENDPGTEVALFQGGVIRAGDEDLNLAELLEEGDGTIVVDARDPRITVALDAVPALKRVPVPDGDQPAAGTREAMTVPQLRNEARNLKIAGAPSASKPDLITALDERDRRNEDGTLGELGEAITVGDLVASAAAHQAGDGDGDGDPDTNPAG